MARHCLNVCDIIFSAYDKFLGCDVRSLTLKVAGVDSDADQQKMTQPGCTKMVVLSKS